MCPFNHTAVVVCGRAGVPLTVVTTPIEWMLSVAILIERPKSLPQMLYNRTLQCSKIFKLKINVMCCFSFLLTQFFNLTYLISFSFETLHIEILANLKRTCTPVPSITQLLW